MNADLPLYLSLTVLLGLAGAWAYFGGSRCGQRSRVWWLFVGSLAVAARLVALFTISASDDINRYLWEGELVAQGHSPYTAPADHPRWIEHRDSWWEGMNHKSETTVYPPLTQLIGAALTSLFESPLTFKLFALLCDLVIALLLLRHWGESGASQSYIAAFWLLNPVPVISFAGEGHFDAAMILCSVGALAFGQKQRWALSWTFLATAIAIKWLALVVLPLWLWKSRGRGAWVSLPVLFIPAVPFWGSLDELAMGLLHFGSAFGSNNPVHYALTTITGSRSIASTACAATLALWTFWVLHRSKTTRNLSKPTAQLWCGLILFLPTVTYWYAAWLLPFAAIARSKPWWIFSLTSIFYYAAAWHAQTSGTWHHPPWAIALTWVPLYFALISEWKKAPPSTR